jgi:hypothetical protein
MLRAWRAALRGAQYARRRWAAHLWRLVASWRGYARQRREGREQLGFNSELLSAGTRALRAGRASGGAGAASGALEAALRRAAGRHAPPPRAAADGRGRPGRDASSSGESGASDGGAEVADDDGRTRAPLPGTGRGRATPPTAGSARVPRALARLSAGALGEAAGEEAADGEADRRSPRRQSAGTASQGRAPSTSSLRASARSDERPVSARPSTLDDDVESASDAGADHFPLRRPSTRSTSM